MTREKGNEILHRITSATCRALQEAELYLPPDVKNRLNQAYNSEKNLVARRELENILQNIAIAEERKLPLCQDTGIPVIFMTIPPEIPFSDSLLEAVRDGVRKATSAIPLRPNVVDPLSRHNTGDNTGAGMPPIHVEPGDCLTITAFPKGAGSENVSQIYMLNPSDLTKLEDIIVKTVLDAGARPCPPVILGIGIGGTFDGAALLAKKALLDPIDTMTSFEQDLLNRINRLGIGPMGLGGETTALAVKIRTAGCHTASLPLAINIQCWASRHATITLSL
jgi:fumarate hydratase subunit alpha